MSSADGHITAYPLRAGAGRPAGLRAVRGEELDSPRDAIIVDIGHQAYVHKLLTGRAGRFESLRGARGLSGYPSRAESPHDLVENSHASTALSYADGPAKGRRLWSEADSDRAVVVVIGDGALTGGMAWEALNHLGAVPERPVIVVVNDNGRSYAPTTGALAAQLSDLRGRTGGTRPHRNLFTELGFVYLGPIDGHDITATEAALHRARELGRPVVVHALTVKGKGYDPARAPASWRSSPVPAADASRSTSTPSP
ncbi:1-deoxy-D-xylulose-5-phosphate synthase N-terminal domain-containing protein [Streptomyces sp. NPDC056716]|uniref:1-deoxy-D-xylulose-5-phosphate synthase N-terminal domain-containing protein n=1 Tax=unclassified Streptomyces TaxID=2593676 RepID=UPI0036C92489